LGKAGLVLLAAGSLDGVGLANTGLGLLLVGLILSPRHGLERPARDPLLLLTGAYLAYLGLLTAWRLWPGDPASDAATLDSARRWALVGPLPVYLVSRWVEPRRDLPWLLALALAGLTARVLGEADLAKLQALFVGSARATFGSGAIQFGTWSAIALLGLLVFAPRLPALRPRNGPLALAAAGWALLVVGYGLGLVYAQSRTAWLAAVLVLLAVLAAALVRSARRGAVGLYAGALLLLGASLYGVVEPVVSARVQGELASIRAVLAGELDALPPDSIGLRARIYGRFAEVWPQRPLLGWGPGSSPGLIASSHDPALRVLGYTHFHSSYLTALAELGAVGLALLAVLLVLLARALARALRLATLPPDAVAFLAGSLAMVGLVGLTDEMLASRHGPYVVALLGGVAWEAGRPGPRESG
jgi:O-antigen ligase